MGEEIRSSQFVEADYVRFRHNLAEETAMLARWFDEDRFEHGAPVAGFELEAWLLDGHYRPAPKNEAFLAALGDPMAGAELASFNIELNTQPRQLTGHTLSAMEGELHALWRRCREVAAGLDCQLAMIGILPTVQDEDLNLSNMSQMERYRALNREVIHRRRGKPLVFDINGVEHLRSTHRNVMLESAATSFQIHLQLDASQAIRAYNAGLILAAPMVAIGANSPFLFGKDLWSETRIPVFEQAVAVGGYDAAAFGPIRRVTFGSGYVRKSLMELFQENLEHYPVLLPEDFGPPSPQLRHLRLHNGTIWRWVRPLVGIDEAGSPHLRLEHRVLPAGPSIVDTMANAAFYYGAVTALCLSDTPVENDLPFDKARDNFYRTAQLGLGAQVNWLEGRNLAVTTVLKELLELAELGLEELDIGKDDRRTYLNIIRERLDSGMNGCQWQRQFIARHGRDFTALTAAYLERQESGLPVHEWTL